MADPELKINLDTLDNGLKVLTLSYPVPNAVCIAFSAPYGTSHALQEYNVDSAHFMEHLFFSGTKNMTKAQIWNRERDFTMSNAYTSDETIVSIISAHKLDTENIASLTSDLVCRPTFPVEEIDKERGPFIEEYRSWLDQPRMLARVALFNALFKKNPLGKLKIHSAEEINAIKREDILKIYEQHYKADGSAVVFYGDITPKESVPLAKKYFSELSGKNKEIKLEEEPLSSKPETIRVKKKSVNQAVALTGIKIDPFRESTNDVDRISLGIAYDILSARLMDKLRLEKGLVYGAGVVQPVETSTAAALMVQLSSSKQVVDEAVGLAFGEIDRMHNGEFTQEEVDKWKLARKKNFDISNNYVFSSALSMAIFCTQNKKPLYLQDYKQKLASVTLDNVRKMSKKSFRRNDAITVIVEPE